MKPKLMKQSDDTLLQEMIITVNMLWKSQPFKGTYGLRQYFSYICGYTCKCLYVAKLSVGTH